MREEKRRYFDRAVARANEDPNLAKTFGLIVLVGMEEVAGMECFAGAGLQHTYRTHFHAPDGHEWHLSLTKGKPDAR